MFKEFIESGEPFVIAEVGQNHQGNIDLAREYIRTFAARGADAVKFQVRNNKYLFSAEAYLSPYSSENAFAETYGEHREILELSTESLRLLKEDCKNCGVKFMATPFDELSLEILAELDVDIIKLASFDLGNLPFINKVAKLGKPVVISVGGGRIEEILSSINMLSKFNIEIVVLHCVSEYPCNYDRLGLDKIEELISNFPDKVVGLSDHFNGILSGPIAYMKGARVFEKHVTLNRSWKGTDHSFSLEPEGFRKFSRDLKRVRFMLPPKPESELGQEPVFKKLGKSLVAAMDLEAGTVLGMDNISGKIFNPPIIPVRDSRQIIGSRTSVFIKAGDPITHDSLEKL